MLERKSFNDPHLGLSSRTQYAAFLSQPKLLLRLMLKYASLLRDDVTGLREKDRAEMWSLVITS
jgi:hypothetical protein